MLRDELMAEKQSLEVEVANLEKKRQQLDLINALLTTMDSDKPLRKLGMPKVAPPQPILSLGSGGTSLTDAVTEFLSHRPSEEYTPREIAEHLRKYGYGQDSKHFNQIVTNTCKRQTEKGILKLTIKSGKHAYRVNFP